jgi:hypothetical protein
MLTSWEYANASGTVADASAEHGKLISRYMPMAGTDQKFSRSTSEKTKLLMACIVKVKLRWSRPSANSPALKSRASRCVICIQRDPLGQVLRSAGM